MIPKKDINFHKLADEIIDGIYVCDLDGEILYTNCALASIFGFEKPEDIMGKNFRDFLPPNMGTKLINHFQNALSTGKDSGVITSKVIRKDGLEKLHVRWTCGVPQRSFQMISCHGQPIHAQNSSITPLRRLR